MAAPKLRVIEGGLAREAPRLPGLAESDRLVLPAPPVRERLILALFAGFLLLHVAVVAAVMNLGLFGEPEGSAVEEISVELFDAAPLAAAPAVESADAARPVEADAAAAPVDGSESLAVVDDVADAPTEDASARPVAPATALPVADETVRPSGAEGLPDDVVPKAAETEPTLQANERAAAGPAPVTADAAEMSVGVVAARSVTDDGAEAATPASSDSTAEPVAAEDVAVEAVPPVAPVPAKPAKAAKPAPAKLAKPAARKAAPSAAAGGGKAAASAGGRPAKGLLSSYAGRLSAHLRAFRSYPAAAAARRLSGRAVVQVTIDASGRVLSARVFRSSGHGALDQAALASARSASPFPPIPKDLGISRYTFEAPLLYDLR